MKVLILGAGIDQIQMIKKAKALGYIVYVADKDNNAVGKEYADFFIDIDPKNILGLEDIIKENGILGVCTMASNLIPRYVSELSKRCGLKSISYEASVLATDKQKFKQIFSSLEIPVVTGNIAKNKAAAIKICEELQFPLIMKPTDGSGCRGINIVRDINEVELLFDDSLKSSEIRTVVIEDFLEDSLVFGVESLINKGETFIIGIADKIVRKTEGISTIGVTMPTILKSEDIVKVKDTVERIHKALKIDMGSSHIDFIFHNGVANVIDIGPRLAGGPLIFELINKTTEVDMIEYVLKQCISTVSNPIIKQKNLSAVSLHFFSPIDGELIDYKMPTLHDNMTSSFRKVIGDCLKSYGSNVDRIGYLTCIDISLDKAKEKIIDIIKRTEIIIKNEDGSISTVIPMVPTAFLIDK